MKGWKLQVILYSQLARFFFENKKIINVYYEIPKIEGEYLLDFNEEYHSINAYLVLQLDNQKYYRIYWDKVFKRPRLSYTIIPMDTINKDLMMKVSQHHKWKGVLNSKIKKFHIKPQKVKIKDEKDNINEIEIPTHWFFELENKKILWIGNYKINKGEKSVVELFENLTIVFDSLLK